MCHTCPEYPAGGQEGNVMLRKALLAVVVVAAACFLAPVPSNAAPAAPAQAFSYGSTCVISLTGPPSGLVTIDGTGFRPNFLTTITVNGDPAAQVTTDAVGSFSVTLNLPAGAVVQATCDTDNSKSTAVLGQALAQALLQLNKSVV